MKRKDNINPFIGITKEQLRVLYCERGYSTIKLSRKLRINRRRINLNVNKFYLQDNRNIFKKRKQDYKERSFRQRYE